MTPSTVDLAYAALSTQLTPRLRGLLSLTPEGVRLLDAIARHATAATTGATATPDGPPMSDARRRHLLGMTGPGRAALAAEQNRGR
jgi:hypothetical protein